MRYYYHLQYVEVGITLKKLLEDFQDLGYYPKPYITTGLQIEALRFFGINGFTITIRISGTVIGKNNEFDGLEHYRVFMKAKYALYKAFLNKEYQSIFSPDTLKALHTHKKKIPSGCYI
jgi:hypothetical protein